MIHCINEILSLVINSTIVVGIILLVYFYYKLTKIDSKIEKINLLYEKKVDQSYKRGGVREIIENEIECFKKDRDVQLAPIEREKDYIIKKIPFLK